MLPIGMPTKLERFSVAARTLTPEELDFTARRTASDARRVYAERPGVWPTFPEYLAFVISEAGMRVFGGRLPNPSIDEYEDFYKLCRKHAGL